MPVIRTALEELLISSFFMLRGYFVKEIDAVNLDLPCYRIILVYAEVDFLVDFRFVDFVEVEHGFMGVGPVE